MAYRSVWKGFLRLAQIACPVVLYSATGEADRQRFATINPATGNKVNQQWVDAGTGELVEAKGKGIEVAPGVYKQVTDEEIEAAAPNSTHTIAIAELVPRAGIDWLFPDSLYYLGPDGLAAGEAFGLIRDGIKASRLVALGQLSLGTREHMVLIEPGKKALKVSTLRYAAEVRSEDMVLPKFVDVPYPDELVGPVAKILAARSRDRFEPAHFTDRYATAIAELIRDKIAGTMVKRMPSPPPRLIELRKAVKRSAEFAGRRDNVSGTPARGRKGRAA
jgi:Ku protein